MVEPGCYGIPSIFSFKSEVCGSCSHASNCQSDAHSALLALKRLPIVADVLNEHNEYVHNVIVTKFPRPARVQLSKPIPVQRNNNITRVALTEEQLDTLEALPKKVQTFLRAVWARGEDKTMWEAARNGLNPFEEDRNRPYHLAYQELMKGKVSRAYLSNVIMDNLGWAYSSAYSQVSMIWRVLPCLNLATVTQAYMERIPLNANH